MKDKVIRVIVVYLLNVAMALSFTSLPTNGDDSKDKRKKRAASKMIEIPSPNKKIVLVFSNPLFLPSEPKDDIRWTKLIIKHKDGEELYIVEDLSRHGTEAIFPTEWWSPDGRYLVMVRANNVSPKGEHERHNYDYLDVCTGTWVYFRGEDQGKVEDADTSNFMDWDKKQPHTMLINGKSGKYIEAFPVLLPDPEDCGD